MANLLPFASRLSTDYSRTMKLSDFSICVYNFGLPLYVNTLSVNMELSQGYRVFLLDMPSAIT